ncbi:MAG TPA: glutamate--tRNA ligase, partial [Burkholderiales bacterium]|nr:glutamate--tRNA ligase [Burkholderiales bacterium]
MIARPFKTRFAPSPTGLLHLGNVRTALFNYLFARRHGGIFLLRLEDTDAMRGHEKYAVALMEDLRWLGLQWDEGPQAGGTHGPYEQSRRGEIYRRYFVQLDEQGLAYPCFCCEHELSIARKTAIAAGRPPRYSGKCRALSPEDVRARFAQGVPATLRFRVPEGRTVTFEDRVRGPQSFATDDIGDFVIRRSDGTPAFFFCNAIDDAVMGVTLVVRGEDHLTNTPRQLMLLEALGLPVPQYAHIALVVGADGAPLSKRTGGKSVQELRTAGFLPSAVNNYLARLGHTYDANDFMSLEVLAQNFDLERLHRAPAR